MVLKGACYQTLKCFDTGGTMLKSACNMLCCIKITDSNTIIAAGDVNDVQLCCFLMHRSLLLKASGMIAVINL